MNKDYEHFQNLPKSELVEIMLYDIHIEAREAATAILFEDHKKRGLFEK